MMKRYLIIVAVSVLLVATIVVFGDTFRRFRSQLSGYQEVPVVSTVADGNFKAEISRDDSSIDYELSYEDLEGTVQQAHIHFGQKGVNGAIQVWLCSNLASPPTPAGVQPCPAPPATVTGTIVAANVTGQPAGPPAGQGIQPGEFAELIRAIRAGKTYANVHTNKFPGGEIRSQIGRNGRGDDDDDNKHTEHGDHK
ncbi:MAG: CHRD domain-containing protein [Pyrinomonadaceae bacterium]